ncbi:DUF881 domain-containing protein [Salsuginibacillus kocurii]|uniref:DUF881 domain-containing protein n=1 Tax=Salsuginibacillus kocurii TaxID=427078 RepID=UPI00035E3BFA|nr:DUF881 domain-containing protein [Salsuginibacillus kocurii]
MKNRGFQYGVALFLGLVALIVVTLLVDTEIGPPSSSSAAHVEWEQREHLQERIMSTQDKNRELEAELRLRQSEVSQLEEKAAETENSLQFITEQIEQLRMLEGEIAYEGPGVKVSLDDYSYIPEHHNPNDYIVHDRHVQQVIDELLAAGAEAVAVNGTRINRHSYIQCLGPVIEVDGTTSFAPFVITAIGPSETLSDALQLSGGTADQLLNEQIQVRIQQVAELSLPAHGMLEEEAL